MNEDDNILDFDRSDDHNYTIASKGKRFANYIIDAIVYTLISFAIGFIIAIFTMDNTYDSLFYEEGHITTGERFFNYLYGAVLLFVYYSISEYYMKGKSIGKYITKTRAVTLNNERMDLNTTIKRSLCRIIPFEAFSFLGEDANGWHDKISETKVIEDEDWFE